VLSDDERTKLEQWARCPKTSQRLALRARIVLGCADGTENRRVARQLRVTDQTVCKWRERFRRSRLEGLTDEPRPGTPRRITDDQIEALITRTLESQPPDSTHWSTRTMAKAIGMSSSWRVFCRFVKSSHIHFSSKTFGPPLPASNVERESARCFFCRMEGLV
jgi:transposase